MTASPPPPPPTPIPHIPIHPHAAWAAWAIPAPSGTPRAGMEWASREAISEPQTPSKKRTFTMGMIGREGDK